MKLYLSSYRIPTPQDLYDMLGKEPKEINVAVIPNAKDYYSKRAWEYKVKDFTSYIMNLGMRFDVVDLREYSKAQTLMERLKQSNLVWAMGGNTFCLRYEMRRSSFDSIIHELVASGIVYGGDSAGAIVAGKTLKGVESADEPNFAEDVIVEGLSLISFAVVPHIDSDDFKDAVVKMKAIHQADNTKIIELKDSQAAIFTNENFKITEGLK